MPEANNLADLTENYLSLGKTGEIKKVAGGDQFWSLASDELEKFGKDWLITEFYFDEDWKTWEMHPNGEEIVYLLSGEMDLILEAGGERKIFQLRRKGLVIVPRGAWHTGKFFQPSNVLVITRGEETQVRPID